MFKQKQIVRKCSRGIMHTNGRRRRRRRRRKTHAILIIFQLFSEESNLHKANPKASNQKLKYYCNFFYK
jgi:hypothetical protein